MDLAELVAHHHDTVIEMFTTRARAAGEAEGLSRIELIDSVPYFLDGLVESLAAGRTKPRTKHEGADHGNERLQSGFRIDAVVREYFILAACILEAAASEQLRPSDHELHTLLRAIGDGAAAAAIEYMHRREADLVRREATHAGFLAHEVRSSLAGAAFAFELLRKRELAGGHELARVVDENLRRATQHVDEALLGQRLLSVGVARSHLFLRRLVADIVAELQPQIDDKSIIVSVSVDPSLTLAADPRLLRSALTNLIGNAVKFTRRDGRVAVRGIETREQIVIEIEDECGGLPAGGGERLFQPFVQAGTDHSGFGLGLGIARAAVEAQGGALQARDLPDQGCIFTLTLPRKPNDGE